MRHFATQSWQLAVLTVNQSCCLRTISATSAFAFIFNLWNYFIHKLPEVSEARKNY
jgi:hypothetical protein